MVEQVSTPLSPGAHSHSASVAGSALSPGPAARRESLAVQRARSGKDWINSPTPDSMPASSAGRPEVTTPKTTSRQPLLALPSTMAPGFEQGRRASPLGPLRMLQAGALGGVQFQIHGLGFGKLLRPRWLLPLVAPLAETCSQGYTRWSGKTHHGDRPNRRAPRSLNCARQRRHSRGNGSEQIAVFRPALGDGKGKKLAQQRTPMHQPSMSRWWKHQLTLTTRSTPRRKNRARSRGALRQSRAPVPRAAGPALLPRPQPPANAKNRDIQGWCDRRAAQPIKFAPPQA